MSNMLNSVKDYNRAITAVCNGLFRIPTTPRFWAKRAEKEALIDKLELECLAKFGVDNTGQPLPVYCVRCRQAHLSHRPLQHARCV